KKPIYRPLSVIERDILYALYDKWNGRMSQMLLDPDCLFKAYTQIHYYCTFYHFKEQFLANRKKRALEVQEKLQDAKMLAIENAMRILESHNVFVRNKFGIQLFDSEGKPLIIEQLPYYKEIKTAWEIIKTELGEPTTIGKNDITSGGKPLNEIKIVFEEFNEPKHE